MTGSNISIIHLSDLVLNAEETNILSRGLSYCAPEDMDYVQTQIDCFKFTRKLRLAKYFAVGRASRRLMSTMS